MLSDNHGKHAPHYITNGWLPRQANLRIVKRGSGRLTLVVLIVGHVLRPRSAESSRRCPGLATERALASRDGSHAAKYRQPYRTYTDGAFPG